MKMLDLREVMEDAVATIWPKYETLRKKLMIWGFLNLKNNLISMRKKDAYYD